MVINTELITTLEEARHTYFTQRYSQRIRNNNHLCIIVEEVGCKLSWKIIFEGSCKNIHVREDGLVLSTSYDLMQFIEIE